MSERSDNGTAGREASAAALRGRRRSVAADRQDGQNAERALEQLRLRTLSKSSTPDAKVGGLSKVLIGEREHRLYLLAPGQVDYIESHGNYVEFHAGALVFISRDSIKRLSRVLAGSGYLRIQRTLLLNYRSIVYAQRAKHGRFAFTLSSGACLCSGARYRAGILKVLPLTRARRQGGT
jgi:DNA-binding LytR/AlgR family response regulator